MKKETILHISVAVGCIIIGFLIGKNQNPTAQQTTPDAPYQQEAINNILSKTKQLLKDGNLAEAELYFVNGIHQYPGNWSLIAQYFKSIVAHAQTIQAEGDYESALNLLNDLETFVRAQVLDVSTENIENFPPLFQEITQQKHAMQDARANALLQEAQRLQETVPSFEDAEKADAYLEPLRNVVFSLNAVEVESLKNAEFRTTIPQAISQIEHLIEKFERHVSARENASNAALLAARADEFIEKAKQAPPQSDMTLYY